MRMFRIVITNDDETVCTAFKRFATWKGAEEFAIALKELAKGTNYSVHLA